MSWPLVALAAALTLASGCAATHNTALEPPRRSTPGPAYAALGPGHYIRANEDGHFITLEDGSVWEIERSVWFSTVDWEVQAPVTVRRSNGDGVFTYELDNTQEDEGAPARYVPPR
jgi:hypothetical protein